VEIAASGELIDLAAEGFDAGIRMGQFVAADMVAVPLTPPFRLIIVGSPAYFASRSRPICLDDLRQHACLRWRRSNGALAPWSFNDDGQAIEIAVSGPFIAHDFPTILGAAVEGIGLAQLPEPMVAEGLRAGKLVHVLEAFAPARPGMFLCYPSRRQIMPKLRAFIDHVKNARQAMAKSARTNDPGHAGPRGGAKANRMAGREAAGPDVGLRPQGGAATSDSQVFQEAKIEGRKHQDNADIRDQPFPEPIPEEQKVHPHDDGDQHRDVKHD
jgi:hypothetical protein